MTRDHHSQPTSRPLARSATKVYRKARPGVGADYFRAEAAGLRWLETATGPPVVPVIEVGASFLLLAEVTAVAPTRSAAAEFGQQLARLHRAGAPDYGSPPEGAPDSGYIADLPMPYGDFATFGPMYADLRVVPYLERAAAAGFFTEGEQRTFARLIERLHADDPNLVGLPEPPSRLHGDLWSGNVMYGRVGEQTGAWLIDPAAHGGHRESDLAMLALFGAPYLDDLLSAYDAEVRLAPGWRLRVPLHQVYPLLVHTVLFGRPYAHQAHAAAVAALEKY